MTLELIQRLAHFGTVRPAAEALRQVDPEGGCDRLMTYGQLCCAVGELAERLRSEFPRGAVVILSHPNELEFAVGFLATLAAGATAFPVHPNLSEKELRVAADCSGAIAVSGTPQAVQVLNRCDIHRIDTHAVVSRTLSALTGDASALSESAHQLSEPDSNLCDGPNLLLQSSGTTGYPKIARRERASLDAVARGVARSLGLCSEDRVLGLVPACHSYGVENVLLAPVYAGASVHLCTGLEPHALLQHLDARGITVFPGVPSIFEMLALATDGENKLRSLRCAYSAGAPLPLTVSDVFAQRLGVRLGQLFGMTEIGSVTFNDPSRPGYDPSSVGLPMEGVRIRIVNRGTRDLAHPLPPGRDGEVAISAPSMLAGYVHGPHRPCEPPEEMVDGFFLTGDQGHLDEVGRLTITGRLKLVVDIGGLKVNLLEVEAVLRDHPRVQDCAVVPMAVSETVSRLKAFVVPTAAECPPSFDELRQHLRSNLSAHKVPRVFELRASLPRSATGKVLRYRLY